MAEMENEIQVYDVEADVDALKDDFDRCKRNLSYYLDRSEEAKKLGEIFGQVKQAQVKRSCLPFPWPHSSDLVRPARRSNYRPRYCTTEVSSNQV